MPKPAFYFAFVDKNGHPLSKNGSDLFPYWSFTKTLLATATLCLVDQDKLKLDDSFEGNAFTLRQVLQHTAGLPSYTSLPDYHRAVEQGETPWSFQNMLERSGDEMLFSPGEGWAYSNIGYALIRRSIEKTTKLNLNDALRMLIFDPLAVPSPFVATTVKDLNATAWGNKDAYDPRWVYHGLVVGTALDAARLLHEILLGSIVPRALVSEMTRAYEIGGALPGRPWERTGYGLGLMIGPMKDAGLTIGHNGNGPGSLCVVHHYPELDGRTIAAFAQGDDEGALERKATELAQKT